MNQTDELTLPIPLLTGGISQQPANIRFPNQVQDANNVDFTVLYGACKRPPTKYVKLLTGITAGVDTRLHTIERDENERYLVIYGDGAIRVFTELGIQPPDLLEATVTHSSDATSYLTNGAVGEQIRLITVADYTIIVNTSFATSLSTSPDYTVTSTWETYETMVSSAQSNNTYHHTLTNSDTAAAGYYYYSSGSQTFGTYQFPTITSNAYLSTSANWNDAASNPMGFRIGFQRLAASHASCTTVLVSGSTYTLTKVGAFTSYTLVAGDMIYVVSGTGVTAGWATIVSRDSDDQITITARGTCVLAAAANVVVNGIGIEYDVIFNFDSDAGLTPVDLYDIASKIQTGLQRAGCDNGLVAWRESGTGGYFVITSPYKGTDSVIRSVSTPPTGYFDITTAGRPFLFSGTSTAGSGGTPCTTQTLSSRWTEKPAPNQSQARPNPASMPLKLVRTNPAVYPARALTGASGAADSIHSSPVAHGLVVGQKVTVAGATGGSPGTINAERTVTEVVSSTQFKTGLDLSGGAATGGTFTARALFSCDTIDWNYRLSGDEVTNEAPQPIQDGLKVRDVLFVQDRFCLAMGNYLVFSQAGDLFNLYAETYSNPVDSDPIVAPLTGQRTVQIDFIVLYRESILAFTFSGEHYNVTWTDALTFTSLRSTQSIRAQCWSTRPTALGNRMYYVSERGSYAQINEYYFDQIFSDNTATDITVHCPTLVPLSIREMCTVETEGVVLCLPDSTADDHKIYVYRGHWNGNNKDQSCWTVYTFDTSYRISGFAPIRNAVYMLVESAGQYFIEVLSFEVTSDTF